jgi:hypothetical protein
MIDRFKIAFSKVVFVQLKVLSNNLYSSANVTFEIVLASVLILIKHLL